MYGAELCFDIWTLTDYLASRSQRLANLVVANFATKVKAFAKSFAAPKLAFAPAAV